MRECTENGSTGLHAENGDILHVENGGTCQDDSNIGIKPKVRKDVSPFIRSSSMQTFSHLQQMENNYSKLGDNGARQKDPIQHTNGRIKVASLSSLNNTNNGEFDPDTVFAGRRDVSDPNSMKEKQIVSHRGSIRGMKNRVRAGIATFIEQQNGFSEADEDNYLKKNYRQLEKGKIIVYTTSMTVIRQSADKCKRVRNVLQTHMVRYEERDMFMSAENQNELKDRLGQNAISVPQVFADGVHIGDYDEFLKMNEGGDLKSLFKNFTKILLRSSCDKCGGYRYLPCMFCHGSKKSLHRNEFTEEFCALRCMQCDENGLVRCDDCEDQQE